MNPSGKRSGASRQISHLFATPGFIAAQAWHWFIDDTFVTHFEGNPRERGSLLSSNPPLDFRNGMRGHLLGDLGRNALDHLRMEGLAKIAEYFCRRDDDEMLEAVGMRVAIECFRKFLAKPFLGQMMPVGFFHGAAGSADACDRSPRTIGTLFPRRRIFPLQNPLDDKMDLAGVAFVAQKESLLAIADENEAIAVNENRKFPGHSACAPLSDYLD